MSKSTPGPWKSEDEDSVIMAGDTQICHVSGEYSEATPANLRLMAAAPDLLEACKAAFAVLPTGLELQKCIDAIDKSGG